MKPTKKIREWQIKDNQLNFFHHILTKFIKIDFNKKNQVPEVSLNLSTLPTIEYAPEFGYCFFVPFNDISILTLEWIGYEPNIFWGVFNSNHPISEIVTSTSYKLNEDLSEIEKFCRSIIHLFDDHRFYTYYKKNEAPSSFMKYIAHLYIHLVKIKEDLKSVIPFKVFLKDKGFLEVNDKLLKSWL